MTLAKLELLIVCCVLPSYSVFAEPAAPTASELKKVIDYYYKGKNSGPILVDIKACTKVDVNKDSPTKGECTEVVSGPVKKGTNVHGWTLWFVPDGGSYDDLVLQYVYEGQVRATMDLTVVPSLRSRAYRASPMSKSGKWEIRALRGANQLGSVTVQVVD